MLWEPIEISEWWVVPLHLLKRGVNSLSGS
jgi:hypothetical protein